jgi:serine/threonine protein kinase
VAIKVISGSMTRHKELQRFGARAGLADVDMREIAVMKNLTHPHCVQLFEVIDDPDNSRTFLIME